MKAPSLLVSYSNPKDIYDLDDFFNALNYVSDVKNETEKEQIKSLLKLRYPPVVSIRSLSLLFGVHPNFIYHMYTNPEKLYNIFEIRKNNGQHREIHSPRVSLKVIQKWIGFHLSNAKLGIENHVYGFIPKKSSIDAAAVHCNSKWILSVDVKNYFSTTHIDVVKKALIALGYSKMGAHMIAMLSSYKENLAQGSPASPVLSNIAFKEVDVNLKKLADQYKINLTRYADDITFSGKGDYPENLKKEVYNIFEPTCWNLTKEKEYFAKLPKRLKVHGLLVHGNYPRLTKGYRNKIRAYKHMLQKGKIRNSKGIHRIVSHIKYAELVDKYKLDIKKIRQ